MPPRAEFGISRLNEEQRLTARETDVVTLICRGLKNEVIARQLHLTNSTVRFHLRNIHRKTDTCDKLDLVLLIWQLSGDGSVDLKPDHRERQERRLGA